MEFFFFKQKTAYEFGTGDWSSDVCSSDLGVLHSSKAGNLANFGSRTSFKKYAVPAIPRISNTNI